MQKAYILHGICDSDEYYSDEYPSASNFHWIPWLQKQLMIAGYNCQTPEVPKLYQANYQDWFNTINPLAINEETILIAHSAGCGFFLKWLSENDIKIKKLVLVAPFIDPNKKYKNFLQCQLSQTLNDRIEDIHVLYSHDEPVEGIKGSVDVIMDTYPKARLHEFDNYGHFCLGHMGSEKFPELLKIVMEK